MRKFIPVPTGSGRKYDGRYNNVLDFIIRYKSENDGTGPTVREIKAACRLSSNSVVSYVTNRLLDAGLIYVTPAGHIGVTGGKWSAEGVQILEPLTEPGTALMVIDDTSPLELVAAGLERREE